MGDFNSIVVIGRLAGDPELRYAPSGAPVCSFSVATSRKCTLEGGTEIKKTLSLEVVVRRRLGELCAQFLKKGREVLVMGSLRQSKGGKVTIVASQVQFLNSTDEADSSDRKGGKA